MPERHAPSLDILALEPYCGGSHAEFLDGLKRHSRHRIRVVAQPPRKWKWRMRAAALTMADDLPKGERPDALLCSDFLDLACFKGLRPGFAAIPAVAYFHENQLTYPLQDESLRDYQYGFTNITTCLVADRVIFNSRFHRDEFLSAIPAFFRRAPRPRPQGAAERIAEKAEALWPGIDLERFDQARADARSARRGPLTILWSHRWEFDKAPEAFFRVLFSLADEGAEFRVCLLGQSFRDSPPVFAKAVARLGGRIAHEGFVESREEYARLVAGCDVFVSTAIHEFFGMAAAEAMAAGCCPLLPDRLAYPELLEACGARERLYEDEADLARRLRRYAENPAEARRVDLRPRMDGFSQRRAAEGFDRIVEALV